MNNDNKIKENRIYLDNAASTRVDKRVLKAMEPFWRVNFGNAGSLHQEGRFAKNSLENARESVANSINAQHDDIIFTSGGTESNNMVIQGVVRNLIKKTDKELKDIHIITSAVEHNSVSDCFRALESEGVVVDIVPVDNEGRVDIEVFKSMLTNKIVLVSFIHSNNEIGTIEDIKKVSTIVQNYKRENNLDIYPLLHTDASQSAAWVKVDVQKLGVDLLTLDSQKMYGPKGAGCLYVKDKTMIAPLFYGGKQEYGLRPGTPVLPLIVGFSKALELVEEERHTYVEDIAKLRDWFIDYILEKIEGAVLNGAVGEGRIPGNINFSFPNIDGEQLVIELDERGVAVSTRSACMTNDANVSSVIKALNKKDVNENSVIRLSMNRYTTEEEMYKVANILTETVKWLQSTH